MPSMPWTIGTESPSERRGPSSQKYDSRSNTADFVAPFVVLDIGGNKYRLIAEMNFSRRVLFIRGIMTHKEYVKGAWKS